MTVRLHKDVIIALNQTGRSWWVAEGTKHHKVFLDGRLVLVVSRGRKSETGRDVKNSIRSIRRLVWEMENGNV